MYCVIQEIETKKSNNNGHPKELISKFMEMSMNGKDISHYYYGYSQERFDRPIKKAYKVSIHMSYRENGKVRKNQYVLCTVRYYDIADGWFTIYDYCERKITALCERINIEEETIYNLVDAKINPLVESIQNEFEMTEEFKASQEHGRITTIYAAKKTEFNAKYGYSDYTYDQIYDVFGNLMNKEKLEEIKAAHKYRKEYEEKSRSYQEKSYSNYSKFYSDSSGSYFESNHSNHGDGDKETLKQFYRVLSKKFHPDSNPDKDTSKEMKLLNTLKTEWGL
jgi:hypothetical protein